MKILKVIAYLLDYPTQELIDNSGELVEALTEDKSLSLSQRDEITELITIWSQLDLYDLQEQYDGLFERGRYVSLLLFEHVHGESRDRGQAMVDLLDVYKSKGYELNSEQMPDYIPLFLEFLSEQEDGFAREWLADISHILALLEERLDQRGSDFQVLFSSLLGLSGVEVDRTDIKTMVAKEKKIDTFEDIDREWEDKEIRFDEPLEEGGSCPLSQSGGAASSIPNDMSLAQSGVID